MLSKRVNGTQLCRDLIALSSRVVCAPNDFPRLQGESTAAEQKRYIFAALSSSLITIGLVRFAYTPLLPILIRDRWFAAPDVVFLSVASLLGYLVGALIGRPLASRFTNVHTL